MMLVHGNILEGWGERGGFPERIFQAAVEGLKGYSPNVLKGLSVALKQRVVARWRASFERLGYSTVVDD